MLLSRGYKRKLINNNIERALLVPRPEAIKKVIRNKDTDRVVFSAQKGLIRALAKSAVCLVNLSANGAKVHGKVPAKDF